MFTLWNSFSTCLLAKSDRIGADRIDLLNQGDAIPLGVRPFFKQVSHKAPPTHNEGGAFFTLSESQFLEMRVKFLLSKLCY